jgi:hypothetical protein
MCALTIHPEGRSAKTRPIFLTLDTEFAKILNLIKDDPPTLRYIPDPSNVYRS